MSHDWTGDVGDFHTRIGYPEADTPTMDMPGNARDRIRHMLEEIEEYDLALKKNDLGKCVDAMVDLIYIAIGTVRSHGVAINPCWDAVQAANMQKVGDPDGNWKNCIKPEGWKPPDLDTIIYKQMEGREPVQEGCNHVNDVCPACGSQVD